METFCFPRSEKIKSMLAQTFGFAFATVLCVFQSWFCVCRANWEDSVLWTFCGPNLFVFALDLMKFSRFIYLSLYLSNHFSLFFSLTRVSIPLPLFLILFLPISLSICLSLYLSIQFPFFFHILYFCFALTRSL